MWKQVEKSINAFVNYRKKNVSKKEKLCKPGLNGKLVSCQYVHTSHLAQT